ncbi:hypothetical protein K3172_08180 [Qipengyuania sp. 6B39]|uniref:hypothetical protein n=1 Tax=Qipengyuania proteolytica TaxID=2867239 RepID=UPI001C8AE0B5|nr:hypothetical protein [Qipengyuania proteolytica]MBX7495832.1 hypothetical protein [Qipengyuania proteolytica]
MKPIFAHAAGALALTFAIAACVPAPDSTPAPGPVATTAPAPSATPAPTPPPAEANWIDRPQTTGTWRISGSQAAFVERDSQGGTTPPSIPLFIMECRNNAVRLMTQVPRSDSRTMIIRTETASRSLALSPVPGGAQPVFAFADLQPRDPLLDAMALTRGRFAVEVPGGRSLYLPNWAEVTRVIEDCR